MIILRNAGRRKRWAGIFVKKISFFEAMQGHQILKMKRIM